MMRQFLRITLVITATAFLQNTLVLAQDWQQLYNEALEFYDQGDLQESFAKGKEALEKSDSDLAKLFTLKLLSTVASESGRYEEGIGFGLQEVHLLNSLDLPDSSIYNSLHTLSVNLMSIEDYNNAQRYLKSCSLAAFRHFGESSYEYNQSLSELGYTYYMLDDPDSALIYLKSANEKLIEDPEGGIDYLNNSFLIGLIYNDLDQPTKAIQSFTALKDILEVNDLDEDKIYAETCENLGVVQYQMEQYVDAEQSLITALNSYSLLGFDNSEFPDLINTLALVYLKLGKQQQSDSLLSLIESVDLSRNVVINQINLANSYYSKKEYESSRRIAEDLESRLNPATNKTILAEVFLIQAKLDLAEGLESDFDKMEFCIQTFTSDRNFERLLESHLYKTRIYLSKNDIINAGQSIDEGLSILYDHRPSQYIGYLIIRGSLGLDLRQGKQMEARATFARSETESLLEGSHREALINDYAIMLQIYGYYFESTAMFKLLVEISDYPSRLEYHIYLIKSLVNQSNFIEAKSELDKLKTAALQNGLDENSKIFAEIYAQRAKVHLNEGNYSDAEIDFRKSISILQNKNIEDDLLNADINNSVAIFYQTIGNYEEAIKYYARAEEFTKEGSSISIDILQNIATLKQIIGDYPESIMILESALEGYENIFGKDHPAYSTSLQNLATAYQKSGSPDKALPYLEEALRIDEANNMIGTVSYTTKLHNLAVLYLDLDMLEESERTFKEVVNTRKVILGESHPDYAFSLYNLAVVLQRTNKYEAAREYFDEAIKLYKTLVKDFFPYLSEKEKSAFYSKLNGAFSAWKDFTVEYALDNPASTGDIFDFQLANKAVLLNSSVGLRRKIAASADESTILLFDKWLSQKEELVKLLALSDTELRYSGKSIEDIQQKATELEKELSLKSVDFNRNRSVDDVSWEKVRDSLKEGDASIEIFRIRKNIRNDSIWYVALIVKHDTRDHPIMEVFEDGKDLEKKWFNLYRNSIRFKVTDTVSFSKFWGPIEKHLSGITSIYVSPDGIFNKVSLSALYDPSDKNYVLNKYNIHYLTNIQELLTVSRKNEDTNKTVHLYGDPFFRMEGDGTGVNGSMITPLPGTALEIESIEGILRENGWSFDTYTGTSASEKNLKLNDHAGVVHIATHGIFLEDNDPETDFYSVENNPLMRSGLLLSGAENTFTGSQIVLNTSVEGEDGVLTAFEVVNMDLSKSDLVILSACDTGLGEVKNGEGVYGLQRAFSIAGAGSVVISLWKVDDEATKNLMVAFYKYYASGKNKFEALSAAQNDMLSEYGDPYYWGAFVMSGI